MLDVRDWRCYPVALLYPPTLENIEYGAVGPVLALLVALAWRYRDRVVAASVALGGAVVLKVFLWPLLVWLAATRRWTAAVGAAALALGLALASWAVIGFDGLGDYPDLLRRLSDVEAENSYSAFAILVALGLPATLARVLVVAWLRPGCSCSRGVSPAARATTAKATGVRSSSRSLRGSS